MPIFDKVAAFMIPVAYAQENPGPAGVQQLQELITRFIGLSVDAAFFALTIMFVYAGIRFIISAGDQKKLAEARQTAVQAVMGVVFLALAWLILKLIEAFTGTPLTIFCLGFPGAVTGCQ